METGTCSTGSRNKEVALQSTGAALASRVEISRERSRRRKTFFVSTKTSAGAMRESALTQRKHRPRWSLTFGIPGPENPTGFDTRSCGGFPLRNGIQPGLKGWLRRHALQFRTKIRLRRLVLQCRPRRQFIPDSLGYVSDRNLHTHARILKALKTPCNYPGPKGLIRTFSCSECRGKRLAVSRLGEAILYRRMLCRTAR
jgi:hypothetical protein